MKKVLKIAGIILGVIALIVVGFVTYIYADGIPRYKAENIELKVEVTPQRVENGERIASMLCIKCHAAENGKLTGRQLKDIPKEFGEVYSKNITQDKNAGIGGWTDGQIMYLLRTGVKPDGQYLPPYMPKFPLVADEDLKDIIAWLRSDRACVQPAAAEAPESKPSFLVKFLAHVAFKALPYPRQEIMRPDTNNAVVLGKYIVNGQIACFACHSRDFKTMNVLEPEKSEGYCGGGNPMLNMEGQIVPTANITFDETGIAGYTEDEFVAAVRYGKKRNGEMARYPMVPHVQLTDKEVKAIYAYLKTIPKIHNEVKSAGAVTAN
jgi:mono/diheme cytochrome c family protein